MGCNGLCRPGTPEWGLLGLPPVLWVLRGHKGGVKVGTVANNGYRGQKLKVGPCSQIMAII